MRRCWGVTRSFRRCGRHGAWTVFCADHRFQPLFALSFLVFTVIAGFASIYSAWSGGLPHFRTGSVPVLLDARLDNTLISRVEQRLAYRLSQISEVGGVGILANDRGPSVVAIDFKFRNAGTAAAFVWKVAVVVEAVKPDLRPVVSIRYRIAGERLLFFARNVGWGTANCSGTVKNDVLENLFPASDLALRGEIASGAEVQIGVLRADARRLAKDKHARKIVGNLRFAGVCTELDGRRESVAFTISQNGLFQPFAGPLVLTRDRKS